MFDRIVLRSLYCSIFFLLFYSTVSYGSDVFSVVPMPDFGDSAYLSGSTNGPKVEATTRFYVCESCPGASDTNENGFGSRERPRLTIPNPIPRGSLVEVAGRYSHQQGGIIVINGAGTAQEPVWLVGVDADPVNFASLVVFEGSYVTIVNAKFGAVVLSNKRHLNHFSVYDSQFSNGGRTLLSIASPSDRPSSDLVLFRCDFSDSVVDWDRGDVDVDAHGIKVGPFSRLWVLESSFAKIGGNAIQIGDQNTTQSQVSNIYVARNEVTQTRQSGIGIKKAQNVVIALNRIYGMHEVQRGNYSAGVAYQYAPEQVWIVFNEIFDADLGVKSGSDTSPIGDNVRIIGNLIYDIHYPGIASRNGWSPGAGIAINGSTNVAIVGNTIDDVDVGIQSGKTSVNLSIQNNILSGASSGIYVLVEHGEAARGSELSTTLFDTKGMGSEKIVWGDMSSPMECRDMLEFRSQCITGNAGFLNALARNYRITEESSAIDAGSASSLFEEYRVIFGSEVSFDLELKPRVIGVGPDIGAIEFGLAPSAPTRLQ